MPEPFAHCFLSICTFLFCQSVTSKVLTHMLDSQHIQQAICSDDQVCTQLSTTQQAVSLNLFVTGCRNAIGNKPPEVVLQFLTQGKYTPRPANDAWAIGLCILAMMLGSRPKKHMQHLNSMHFRTEQMVPSHDIACLPLRAAYFGYLKSLTDGDVAYEQQVLTTHC